MKSKLIIFGLAVLLSSLSYVFAGEGMNQNKKMESMMSDQKENTKTPEAVEVGNKICPVSGDKIPVPGEKALWGMNQLNTNIMGRFITFAAKCA